jgi:hypothetical protein
VLMRTRACDTFPDRSLAHRATEDYQNGDAVNGDDLSPGLSDADCTHSGPIAHRRIDDDDRKGGVLADKDETGAIALPIRDHEHKNATVRMLLVARFLLPMRVTPILSSTTATKIGVHLSQHIFVFRVTVSSSSSNRTTPPRRTTAMTSRRNPTMTKRTSRYTNSSACALPLTMHCNCVRDPLAVCVRCCPCAPCCIDSVYVPCTRRLGWWSMPTCNLSVRKFTTRSCSAWNQLRLRQAKTARASSTRYGSQVLAPLSSTVIYPSVTSDICIFCRQLYTNVHDTMIAEHSNVNKLYKISTEQVHRNQS